MFPGSEDRATDPLKADGFSGPEVDSRADVSVIIPCYNQARFLPDALASVAAQTTPPDEIIVVDDGSTDDTASVAGSHPGVRLIRQANSGLSGARNAGIEASRGRYLVFLDADDRLRPDAIHAGRAALDKDRECALAFGRFVWIEEDGSPVASLPVRRRRPPDAYQAFLEGNFIGMHATVMYRREFLLEAGGFDARLRQGEDYDLYFRIAREHPICEHAVTVAEYRLHAEGMSGDNARMLDTVLSILDAQVPHVTSRSRRRSLERGRRAWKNYYGERMLARTRHDLRNGKWQAAWQGWRTVVRLCRSQAILVVVLSLVPMRLRQLPSRALRGALVRP